MNKLNYTMLDGTLIRLDLVSVITKCGTTAIQTNLGLKSTYGFTVVVDGATLPFIESGTSNEKLDRLRAELLEQLGWVDDDALLDSVKNSEPQ